jgi:hypothetical protein
MGEFVDLLKRRLRGDTRHTEKHDPLHAKLDRPSDPMLSAIKVKNKGSGVLRFVSTLELFSDLEEAKDWKDFVFESGEEKVLPHHYWTVTSLTGAPCDYVVSHAPVGSDFIYKRRDRPEAACSQSEVSENPI